MAEEKRRREKIDGRVASLPGESLLPDLCVNSFASSSIPLPTPRSNPRSSSRRSELSRNRGNTSLCKVVVR